MKTLLTVGISLFAAAALAQTSISPVNIGTTPNDGTGDPMRTAMTKLNANDASLNLNKLETNNPTASGTFTMIRGTTSQRLDLYNTFIDSSNYKRWSLYFASGDGVLEFGSLGTPASGGNLMLLGPSGHDMRLNFGTTGFAGTYYRFVTNQFAPSSLYDAILDLGGSDRRWKNVYGVNFQGDNFVFNTLTFTNPATGPALAYHVGGQVVVTGGPGEVDVQFTGGSANGSAAVVNVSADNLSAGTDVSAANDVTAGNQVSAPSISAGTSVSVAGGSSSLGALTLTLAGATIAQQTQSATSPSRAWRQVNFGFFVSPSGPTNNFFQFDAETLFKGAGDYAGYEWLHQDGSVSFDKAGTTNKFAGTYAGSAAGMFNFPTNADVAFARHEITVANGANSDVAIGTNLWNELVGPSAAFTTHGFANGRDGKEIAVFHQTSQIWTVANESSTDSTAANRIRTLTGGDIILYGSCVAYFRYSGNDSRWIFSGSSLTPHAANRKSIAATAQLTQVAQTFANNTPVPLECRVFIRSESAAVQFTYNGQSVGGTSVTTLNYPTYFLLQPTDTITVTGASTFTADCYTNSF